MSCGSDAQGKPVCATSDTYRQMDSDPFFVQKQSVPLPKSLTKIWAHYPLLHPNPNKHLASDVFNHGLMRMSSSLLLGLVAISFGVSQESKARPSVTRVYGGNDFEGYALDPPCWSYHSRGFGHSKSAHWLYKNHRHVFIDIKLNYADSRSLPPD